MKISLAAIFVFATTTNALCQAAADDYSTSVLVEGNCNSFDFKKTSFECKRLVHNYYLKNDRHGYLLPIPNGGLSISGRQSAERTRLYVDGLIISSLDNPNAPQRYAASGTCDTQNASNGALASLKCEVVSDAGKLTIDFAGNGAATTALQSPSIVKGIAIFDSTFKKSGINGAIATSKACYVNFDRNKTISAAATCFALHYSIAMISSGAKSRTGIEPDAYASLSLLSRQTFAALKALGYDEAGANRQTVDWKNKAIREISRVTEALRTNSNPAASSSVDTEQLETHTLMKGQCATLQLAGRDFECKFVSHFHTKANGRAQFTVSVINSEDEGHVVSFSGGADQKPQLDLYELKIDRMLLNSARSPRDPKSNLPIPTIEPAAGLCRQVGNIDKGAVSGVSCKAMDRNGQSYILEFVTDGSPPKVFSTGPTSDAPKALSIDPNVASAKSWVGRWHVGNVKACKGEEGETDGLIVYKPKEVIGLENNCKITALSVQGTKTALKMRCAGEGMTYNEQEVVEVVNGKLRRTTIPIRRGERSETFDYNRCP